MEAAGQRQLAEQQQQRVERQAPSIKSPVGTRRRGSSDLRKPQPLRLVGMLRLVPKTKPLKVRVEMQLVLMGQRLSLRRETNTVRRLSQVLLRERSGALL